MADIFDPRYDELPINPLEYPARLAHDLAWGVHHKIWRNSFYLMVDWYTDWEFSRGGDAINDQKVLEYIDKMWKDKLFNPELFHPVIISTLAFKKNEIKLSIISTSFSKCL